VSGGIREKKKKHKPHWKTRGARVKRGDPKNLRWEARLILLTLYVKKDMEPQDKEGKEKGRGVKDSHFPVE